MAGLRFHPPIHPIGQATTSNERIALAIALGSMGTLGFSITSPLLPDLADALGVSRGAIGLVQAAVSVPGVIFSVFIGYLADRFGRRRVVLNGLAIFSVFGVAGFFTHSFWGLIAVRFLQGIGTSGILGVSVVLVTDIYEGPARTRAMGYNLAGVTVVSMLGPAISGALASGGLFRPFLVFSVGAPLLVWATRMPADSPDQAPESPLRHVGEAVADMRRRGTLTVFVGVLGVTLAQVGLLHGLGFTTTPLFLDRQFGVPVQIRGFIVASFQVGLIAAALWSGRVRQRWGTSATVTTALVLLGLGAGVVALSPEAWVVPVGLSISGIGYGALTPLTQSYSASATTPAYRGVTVLTWVTVVRLAQVIGPASGSALSEAAGGRTTFGIAAVAMGLLAASWHPVLERLLDRGRKRPPISRPGPPRSG